jgi:cytochrome c5
LFISFRYRIKTLLVGIIFLLGLALLGVQGVGIASPSRLISSQSDEVSEGRNAFGQACIQCHTRPILQRKTEDGWRDTVYSMISRGAQVMPNEIDPLISYLSHQFGPDSSSQTAAASDGSIAVSEKLGQKIIARVCTQCHAIEVVTESRKSEVEWQETIGRMISYGAVLTADEKSVVESYVTEHFVTQ